jgi:hypothetical protein
MNSYMDNTNALNMQQNINLQAQRYYQDLDVPRRLMADWGSGTVSSASTAMSWRGREASPKDVETALDTMTMLKESAEPIEVKETKKSDASLATLKELGFASLHLAASRVAERAMKENLIGVAGYKKIPAEKFAEAKERIGRKSNWALTLALTPVAAYVGQHASEGSTIDAMSLPPTDVLEKMSAAKKDGLFDGFAIIHVAKVPDPILVGQVNGSEDLYFIAEWGNDISFDEMMR